MCYYLNGQFQGQRVNCAVAGFHVVYHFIAQNMEKVILFFFNFVLLLTVWQRNKLYHRSILIILTVGTMIIIDNCCNNNKAISHTANVWAFWILHIRDFEFSMLRWSRLHVETVLIVMDCSFTILFYKLLIFTTSIMRLVNKQTKIKKLKETFSVRWICCSFKDGCFSHNNIFFFLPPNMVSNIVCIVMIIMLLICCVRQ